ncbi:MerR family transcriptional regulator [Treponema parvum]|uniref:MerR family transcriptional regulator n=1 Tax=Treponema parvum TaxID=138851 RepID=A0A975F2B4_9SPIR|nr:MerR family transcriptional regulator [Treponema parvum]QTQ13204.1 MerR family transcriptional regulator [Treponema parvum]
MENYLTIGQMARLNRISEQTLRLYEKKGLLVPAARDELTGYRFYDIRQSAVLDMIRYMKALGMNLKEIKMQLNEKDMYCMHEILLQRQNQIDRAIADLKCQRRAVQRTLESFERYSYAPPDGTIILEYIGKRFLYIVDSGINVYDHDLGTYEKMLRDLKNELETHCLPQTYFYNAGTVLRKENLLKKNFYSSEVFVFVDRQFVPEEFITVLNPGMYLCIYCDNFYKEKDYINRLLEEIRKRRYVISGDYLCEEISDIAMAWKSERDLFLRLQIPIAFEAG